MLLKTLSNVFTFKRHTENFQSYCSIPVEGTGHVIRCQTSHRLLHMLVRRCREGAVRMICCKGCLLAAPSEIWKLPVAPCLLPQACWRRPACRLQKMQPSYPCYGLGLCPACCNSVSCSPFCCMPMPYNACLCQILHAYAIPCMPMPYVACTHSLLCTLFSSAVKGGLGCMQNTSHFWCHGQGMVTKSAWIVSSGGSMSPA